MALVGEARGQRDLRDRRIGLHQERAEAGGATWTPLLLIEYRRSGAARK